MAKTALLAAIVGIAAGTGGQSRAQEPGCSGQVFLYDGTAYSGQLWCVSMPAADVGIAANDANANDAASSAFNETAEVVELFNEPNFAGPSVCLDPGTGVDDLSAVGLDNTISSVAIGSACTT